jgi:hypothetical protein
MHFFQRMRRFLQNTNSDDSRIDTVCAAFRNAISDAEAELEGVSAKVQEYTAWAAYAFDDASDLSTRTPEEEEAITFAENALVAASKRQHALMRHISCLRRAGQSADAILGTEDMLVGARRDSPGRSSKVDGK